ncbi:polysaccharide deacetylase family protein [Desmospora profundinema]|uniref:Peptidoglycan/xylan/chitin deacetylase (PgdA/CDA1 family) n=1 Tax=Desmospora profundinema TaxID=1571184 RepID=A0ABU1IJF3_9BACL|nr:polysaccharide deacetylase family protein [Desmospora profundinema]MDR6224129.1 peptidoglycan/xylan/chitin deacetylase (PgdA/CDA1 family) [Desmospora profundinema]
MGWRNGLAVMVVWSLMVGLTACGEAEGEHRMGGKEDEKRSAPVVEAEAVPAREKREWQSDYRIRVPQEWGEQVTGVVSRIQTSEQAIALTLDACGGDQGSGYDRELVEFLRKQEVPATLFINKRWLEANPKTLEELASDPLFTIENHGTEHRPLSINGRSVYGITGTPNVEAVVEEIEENQRAISERTGRKPRFFRSGTAYYDEVAVEIASELGVKVIHFDVVGDAGATWSAEEVERALMASRPGSIIILHMNQPHSGTAEGVIRAVPRLQEQGFRFVKLDEYL